MIKVALINCFLSKEEKGKPINEIKDIEIVRKGLIARSYDSTRLYIRIIFNVLYISSVYLSLIVNITQHFIQIYSYIIYSPCFIIFWIYISLTIFSPIKIKGCFIGACASESNTKILLNFIPYSI